MHLPGWCYSVTSCNIMTSFDIMTSHHGSRFGVRPLKSENPGNHACLMTLTFDLWTWPSNLADIWSGWRNPHTNFCVRKSKSSAPRARTDRHTNGTNSITLTIDAECKKNISKTDRFLTIINLWRKQTKHNVTWHKNNTNYHSLIQMQLFWKKDANNLNKKKKS